MFEERALFGPPGEMNRRSTDPCAGRGYLAKTPPIPSEICFRIQPNETCDDDPIDLNLHKSESSEAFKNSDDAVVPRPGEDRPRASVIVDDTESELIALRVRCSQLQTELDVERDRANKKEAAFALLARKYDESLKEKATLRDRTLSLQTENGQQSLHLRILTREIELLKRGQRTNSSSNLSNICRDAQDSDHVDPAAVDRVKASTRRLSVDVIERELSVLRGLDDEGHDSSKSLPPNYPTKASIGPMRRLASHTSNVSDMSSPNMVSGKSRVASRFEDGLRCIGVPFANLERSDSDNTSSDISYQNSKHSCDGRSSDARYLEDQSTSNVGTSLECDEGADNRSSSYTYHNQSNAFHVNTFRPGVVKMDPLRTLRASNSLTASMTVTEYSFQPSVMTGSNDNSDRSGRFGPADYCEKEILMGSKEIQ